MTHTSETERAGTGVPVGSQHYRAFVGPPEMYDLVGAMQFNLLTFLGLRERHRPLDIGCGSLRAGKLFITYLLPGRYCGIEPEEWLIQEGIHNELGEGIRRAKRPLFSHDRNFALTTFNRRFDFVLAHSIFSHAPQHQISRCLGQAKRVMHRGSIFAGTFLQGQVDYTGSEWVYPQCVTYTVDRMVQLAAEQCLVCRPIDWPHPNHQTWILMTVRDSRATIPDLHHPTASRPLEDTQSQVRYYADRLSQLERHPYVRFGRWLNRLLTKARPWNR